MKILKLIFENINSYQGKVEIDFMDPEFQKGNNQFVISGPMGAGKSTILDAVTLALYGTTARLGRLTTGSKEKSGELINKHSGYCRSEVVYSCAKGVFRSIFYQRKAHGNVWGNLQDPECALYEMNDVVERQLLDKASTDTLQKKTEEVIGLNYEQFILCTLIPQGEFDRFLTSDDRVKASILAKLSHTEHYKEAAKSLCDEYSKLQAEYDALKKEWDAIPVMSEEERAGKENENSIREQKVKDLTVCLKELQEKIRWVGELQAAEKRYQDARKKLAAVNAGQEAYQQKKEELDKARKAEDCAVEYEGLCTCVKEQERLIKDQEKWKNQLEVCKIQRENAKTDFGECENNYNNKKTEKEGHQEIWKQVRALDQEISGLAAGRKEKKSVLEKAEKTLEDKKKRYEENKQSVGELEQRSGDLNTYLDENSPDASLEGVLASFDEKMKSWKAADHRSREAVRKKTKCGEKKEQLQERLEKLKGEKETISNELHQLVSREYLTVAGILRQNLKSGNACPVCGKLFTPGDGPENHVHEKAEMGENQSRVAGIISTLNDAIESKDKEIRKAEGGLSGVDADIRNAEDTEKQAGAELADLLSEINHLLEPWDKQLDGNISVQELDSIRKELNARKETYTKKKNEFDRIKQESSNKKAEMDGIDLTKLQDDYKKALGEFEKSDANYKEVIEKRKELYGEKQVDEEEKAFDQEIENLEKKKNSASDILQKTISEYSNTESRIKDLQERNEEKQDRKIELEKKYNEKLQNNQFASEEEFLSCRKKKKEMDELDKEVKEYEEESIRVNNTYQSTQEEWKRIQQKALTVESLDALNAQQETKNQEMQECNQEIGALKESLEQDTHNRKKREDKDSELQALGEKVEIFNTIKTMIGKNDGADFEVFVQGIAMRSLLVQANKYLGSIIPTYQLAQKEENSIGFLVRETMGDGTVINREISNFSGGEKFIISLSLALAMSEFAGKNGDVECIFLDEGFGTLSGEPLEEAVNALKKLSSTGKMLGIITHIDAVIQQFNQITAVKTGEKSILRGPGVTYMELPQNQKKNRGSAVPAGS